MVAEYNCDLCEKTYVREGNLTKHMAKHSELEKNQVGAVTNVVTPVVQVATGPLFVDIVIPVIDDFPEMEEIDMTLIEDHEAANQLFGDIGDCVDCDTWRLEAAPTDGKMSQSQSENKHNCETCIS